MQMNQKDRTALIIGGLCVVFFLCVQLIVIPSYKKKKRLEKVLVTKQQNLAEMQEMQTRFLQLSSLGNSITLQLEKRKENFSLFSFLEEKAGNNGIKDKITYMKPSDTVDNESFRQILVEMKLQSINLKQLVSFLEEIESPENLVALQRISIQENKKNIASLDVLMQVISIDRLDNSNS